MIETLLISAWGVKQSTSPWHNQNKMQLSDKKTQGGIFAKKYLRKISYHTTIQV